MKHMQLHRYAAGFAAFVTSLLCAAPHAGAACTERWIQGASLGGPTGTIEEVRAFTSWTPPGASAPLLIVGGNFASMGAVSGTQGIAAWDGAHWASLGGGVSGRVNAFTISGGNLYVAGYFTAAGGFPVHNIAMWDGTVWHPLTTDPDGTGRGPNGEVFALTTDIFGQVWMGGWFSQVYTYSMKNLAIFHPAVSLWSTTSTGMNQEVDSLTVYNGHVVAGGEFTTADGVPAQHIAYFVFNDGWHPFGPGLGGAVLSLYVSPNNNLIAGGAFVASGNGLQTLSHIASWDTVSWNPIGTGLPDTVRGITMYNNQFVAIGNFVFGPAGNQVSHIARLTNLGWSAMGAGVSDTGRAVFPFGPELYVGGSFMSAGGLGSPRIATWTNAGPWLAQQPKPVTAAPDSTAVVPACVAQGYSGLTYQWRRNGTPISNGPGGATVGGGMVAGAWGSVPLTGTVNLTIQGTKPSDAGNYDVVISGGCAPISSIVAALSIAGAGPSDLNGDGHINTSDLILMLVAFGTSVPPGSGADINGDGHINTLDLTLLLQHFGQ